MPQPGTFPAPVAAQLVRALAGAVAGFQQTGMYFMASYDQAPEHIGNLYDVSGPYFEGPGIPPGFQPLPPEIPAGYGLFGPFDNSLKTLVINPTQQKVTRLDVYVNDDHDKPAFSFPGKEGGAMPYDALFFSIEAVGKFALPYYNLVYSNADGTAIMQSFAASPLALGAHLPWSEYLDTNTSGLPDTAIVFDLDGTPRVSNPHAGS